MPSFLFQQEQNSNGSSYKTKQLKRKKNTMKNNTKT